MDQDIKADANCTDLLEIDTFRVVKDEDYGQNRKRGANNSTKHWIAHMCKEYVDNEDHSTDQTGLFDADEIKEGSCYYCKTKIPEPIVALWSMLEWQAAGDILHKETSRMYPVQNKPVVI